MDLTTVAAAKRFLSISGSNQDQVLAELIARESRAVERYTACTFPMVERVAKRLDGTGTDVMVLPDLPLPLLEVTAVSIQGVNVPAGSGYAGGFVYDDRAVYLQDGKFPRGRQNVMASWRSGFQAETATLVPAPTGNAATATLSLTSPAPALVISITDDAGAAFVETANAPAAGEYRFTRPDIEFAAADASRAITVSMYYVPGDVEQACIEMLGTDLQQRNSLGFKSKTLAGENIVYDNNSMQPSARQLLEPYRKRVPV